jgi:hypothetical protein
MSKSSSPEKPCIRSFSDSELLINLAQCSGWDHTRISTELAGNDSCISSPEGELISSFPNNDTASPEEDDELPLRLPQDPADTTSPAQILCIDDISGQIEQPLCLPTEQELSVAFNSITLEIDGAHKPEQNKQSGLKQEHIVEQNLRYHPIRSSEISLAWVRRSINRTVVSSPEALSPVCSSVNERKIGRNIHSSRSFRTPSPSLPPINENGEKIDSYSAVLPGKWGEYISGTRALQSKDKENGK